MLLARTRLKWAAFVGLAAVTLLLSLFLMYGGCSGAAEMYEMGPGESVAADYGLARKVEATYQAGVESEVGGEPAIEAPDVDPARTERLVVYNAVMNVVVDRISDSLNRIKDAVEKMGGYMHEMGSNSITLKIPAAKFDEAISEVEKLGEVAYRDIKGTDVTDQMRDLKIRVAGAGRESRGYAENRE
jgi:hypothetical protein